MTQQQSTPKMWYDEPGCLKIRLEPGEATLYFLDHDTLIIKEINGVEMTALVPTHSLPEERNWVPVQLAREYEGKVLIHFPVSNEGRPAWTIPQDAFRELVYQG